MGLHFCTAINCTKLYTDINLITYNKYVYEQVYVIVGTFLSSTRAIGIRIRKDIFKVLSRENDFSSLIILRCLICFKRYFDSLIYFASLFAWYNSALFSLSFSIQ